MIAKAHKVPSTPFKSPQVRSSVSIPEKGLQKPNIKILNLIL